MYNEDIRLAIDVGSSKVCSVVIRRDNYNEPEMLAVDVLPSETIHDGDVMNLNEATAVVRASVNEVSSQCSLNFTKAYVGFGGKHVNSYAGWGRGKRVRLCDGSNRGRHRPSGTPSRV